MGKSAGDLLSLAPFVLELSFGNFHVAASIPRRSLLCLKTHAWDLSFAGFNLGVFVRELSLGNLRLGTFVWNCSFRTASLGSLATNGFVWDLVLTSFRIRTFVQQVSLGSFEFGSCHTWMLAWETPIAKLYFASVRL